MFYRIFKSIVLMSVMTLVTIPTVSYSRGLQEVIDQYCKKNCVTSEKLLDVSSRAAKLYDIDVRAILAIVHIESKYHIKAKNGSSMGLSQVLIRYHKPKFKGTNYFDVEDNIFAGMQVFKDCLKRTKGNYPKAFKCYNGGGDADYVTKANKAYDMMKSLDLQIDQVDSIGSFISKITSPKLPNKPLRNQGKTERA